MKFVIASDIHGSEKYCKMLVDRFFAEKADNLVLLGDVLYHGPRNPLPDGYSPKGVCALLNPLKESIICVKGNCDSEVDQMVLEFPLIPMYSAIFADGYELYLTHGHVFGKENPLPLKHGSTVCYGHTHVPDFSFENGVFYVNPGSVSLPKNDSERGYIVFENGTFTRKTLDGEILEMHKFSSHKLG